MGGPADRAGVLGRGFRQGQGRQLKAAEVRGGGCAVRSGRKYRSGGNADAGRGEREERARDHERRAGEAQEARHRGSFLTHGGECLSAACPHYGGLPTETTVRCPQPFARSPLVGTPICLSSVGTTASPGPSMRTARTPGTTGAHQGRRRRPRVGSTG